MSEAAAVPPAETLSPVDVRPPAGRGLPDESAGRPSLDRRLLAAVALSVGIHLILAVALAATVSWPFQDDEDEIVIELVFDTGVPRPGRALPEVRADAAAPRAARLDLTTAAVPSGAVAPPVVRDLPASRALDVDARPVSDGPASSPARATMADVASPVSAEGLRPSSPVPVATAEDWKRSASPLVPAAAIRDDGARAALSVAVAAVNPRDDHTGPMPAPLRAAAAIDWKNAPTAGAPADDGARTLVRVAASVALSADDHAGAATVSPSAAPHVVDSPLTTKSTPVADTTPETMAAERPARDVATAAAPPSPVPIPVAFSREDVSALPLPVVSIAPVGDSGRDTALPAASKPARSADDSAGKVVAGPTRPVPAGSPAGPVVAGVEPASPAASTGATEVPADHGGTAAVTDLGKRVAASGLTMPPDRPGSDVAYRASPRLPAPAPLAAAAAGPSAAAVAPDRSATTVPVAAGLALRDSDPADVAAAVTVAAVPDRVVAPRPRMPDAPVAETDISLRGPLQEETVPSPVEPARSVMPAIDDRTGPSLVFVLKGGLLPPAPNKKFAR